MARLPTTLLVLACLTLAACGGGSDPEATEGSAATTGGPAEAEPPDQRSANPGAENDDGRSSDEVGVGSEEGSEGEPSTEDDGTGDFATQLTRSEREVARTVREYVGALDRRDGERLCSILADPPGLEGIELPRSRGNCAESLAASIGFRDPRGLPVWESAAVASVTVEVDGDSARAIATVVTEFADRDQPSIEDDVVYLVRKNGRWTIAKPSSTLLRAVGIADVPPSVLTPP